jgi:hypothetical protein
MVPPARLAFRGRASPRASAHFRRSFGCGESYSDPSTIRDAVLDAFTCSPCCNAPRKAC